VFFNQVHSSYIQLVQTILPVRDRACEQDRAVDLDFDMAAQWSLPSIGSGSPRYARRLLPGDF